MTKRRAREASSAQEARTRTRHGRVQLDTSAAKVSWPRRRSVFTIVIKDAILDSTPTWARFGVLGEARALAYRGDRVTCPCCDGSFRGLRAHRARADVKCPRCGSLERHRLLWLYFERRTNLLVDDLEVLHVAPEYSFEKRLAARGNLRYVTADLDSPLASVQLDVMDMPFDDASFDVVLCNHVLEHVADDRIAMREIRRILRPGGWAILLVPVDLTRDSTFEDASISSRADRLRHYGQEDHARLYGRDYVDRLRDAGFDVTVDCFGSTLPTGLVERHRLLRDGVFEPIYRCDRPQL